jgi:uncharacterized protein
MSQHQPQTFTAFEGPRRLVSGPLPEVALAVKRAEQRASERIAIFSDATGRAIDLDLRDSDGEIVARLQRTTPPDPVAPQETATPSEPRGRGRPKLGVEAHEVTLLPRHWNWLRAQPGGASIALRKLVEAAGRDPKALRRRAQECAYRFMSAIGGDLPCFEEASRMLFAGDGAAFTRQIAAWPADIRAHLAILAAPAFAGESIES